MHRVLIIDDDPCIREILSRKLSTSGFAVSVAGDGNAGYETARAEMPDVILLDWMMPGPSGPEICARIRQDPALAHIKIFMVTAKVNDADVQHGIEMGADAYITKPFSPRDVLARVQAAVGDETQSTATIS